jgi:ubiquinone/menaquinone biosynthesis C-methylase UbiE
MSKEIDFKQIFNDWAPRYMDTFGQLSLVYARHILDSLSPIDPAAIIHDNATGPGTVAFEIVSRFPNAPRPTIHATDFSEGMIDNIASQDSQKNILTSVMDSESLTFKDNTFTHSITNFAIFLFPNPDKAASEIFRTLKPGGTAIVTTWKDMAYLDLLHRTQKRIRPDHPELILYDNEWDESNKLLNTLVNAGFDVEKIRIQAKEDNSWPVEKAMRLAISDVTEWARKELSEEENERWGDVLKECLTSSEKQTGTIRVVAWVAVATK